MTEAQLNVEEQPKKEVAQNVVTPKRKYFVPSHGVVIEADSLEEAVAKHKANLTKEKAGDQ